MKIKSNLIVILSLIGCIVQVSTDAVCTEQILITELVQDLKDNGKLDCLRVPRPAPTDKPESDLEKKNRIEAAWDTGRYK